MRCVKGARIRTATTCLCEVAEDRAEGFGSERERVYNAPDVGIVDSASEGQMMFDKIQHIGYLVADLDKAVAWFEQGFGATNAGGGAVQSSHAVPGGGRNAFVHFGQVEAELIEQLPAQPNTVGVGQGVKVDKIIHAGYLVRNAAEAVAWYVDKFDGVHVGGGASRRGGRNAFVNFGQVQVELIEPQDPSTMGVHHLMDHVGYVTQDIGAGITECCCRGFQFVADAPNTNAIGQQVLYFETNTSMGSRMHLTQLPA